MRGYAPLIADTLLRAGGGRPVGLRLPLPAVPADPTEQLGLATPQFQDVPLGPAVLRKARAVLAASGQARWELLLSATAVTALAGTMASSSASALFAAAAGVVLDGVLHEIVSVTAEQAAGQPYVWRLVLRAPLAQIL